MIIIGFVNIIKDIVTKPAAKVKILFIFQFLSTIIYFQNVAMVTKETIEPIHYTF